MKWFRRRSHKQNDDFEHYETHTPTKSILRSSTRSNPSLDKSDGNLRDLEPSITMSLVNLRVNSPNVKLKSGQKRNESQLNTNRFHLKQEEHNRHPRTVLFLDQVVSRDRKDETVNQSNENKHEEIYQNYVISSSLPRTVSPFPSYASYPTNYEPSPLIKKKNSNTSGVELISWSPLPIQSVSETLNINQSMQLSHNNNPSNNNNSNNNDNNGNKYRLSKRSLLQHFGSLNKRRKDKKYSPADKYHTNDISSTNTNHNDQIGNYESLQSFDMLNISSSLTNLRSQNTFETTQRDQINSNNNTNYLTLNPSSVQNMEADQNRTPTIIKLHRHSSELQSIKNRPNLYEINQTYSNYYLTPTRFDQNFKKADHKDLMTPTGSTETLIGSTNTTPNLRNDLTIKNFDNKDNNNQWNQSFYEPVNYVRSVNVTTPVKSEDNYIIHNMNRNDEKLREISIKTNTVNKNLPPINPRHNNNNMKYNNNSMPRVVYVRKTSPESAHDQPSYKIISNNQTDNHNGQNNEKTEIWVNRTAKPDNFPIIVKVRSSAQKSENSHTSKYTVDYVTDDSSLKPPSK